MDWFKRIFPDKTPPTEAGDRLVEEVEPKKSERKLIRRKQVAFDAASLATSEKRPKDVNRSWFAVDPGVFYPATIERIQEVLATDVYPDELDDPATNSKIDSRSAGMIILHDANRVSEEEWGNALKHRQSFDNARDAQVIQTRAFALDVARRWFTQALHVQAGGDGTPMGLHILENIQYKS